MLGWKAALGAGVLGIALAAGGCGRKHDLLAAGQGGGAGGATSSTRASTSAGPGGHGGQGGHRPATSSTATGGAGGPGGSGSAAGGAGGGGGSGPVRPTSLTLVNGVNDQPAIRLCFMPYPGGDPAVMPWPPDATGMPFAQGRWVKPITDAIPAGTDIRPWVLAGDLTQAAGKTCAAILAATGNGGGGAGGAATGSGATGSGTGGAGGAGGAGGGGPTLLVAPLAVLPAAVFTSNRSVLLVPVGCIDGTHTDGAATLACGFTYTVGHPTLDLVAVSMSRAHDPAHLGLQAVHAAAAMQTIDLHLVTGAGDTVIGPALTLGAISAPDTQLAVVDLTPLGTALIKTFPQNSATASSATPLTSIFGHGNVAPASIQNGDTIAFVAVGAYPGLAAGPWWHELTYSLVNGDP